MGTKTKIIKTTEFSAKLCEYINESNLTVYKISKLTGLGRTAIQHTMSGSLLPTKEFIDKLCSVLIVTPTQKKELVELYTKEKIGPKRYYDRKQIRNIIENLPQYYINMKGRTISNSSISIPTDKTASGILNVNQTLINVISKELMGESPEIYSTIPFENKILYDTVLQLFVLCNKDTAFEHYMRIYKNSRDVFDCNLNTVENILKMSMNAGVAYKPYCYYAYKEAADDNFPLFPYCLITSEYVVMVSADYQHAEISYGKRIVELAKNHIDQLKQHSIPMVELVDNKNTFDIFARSSRMFDKSLEFQPCLSKYLTLEIVSKRLKDIPEKEYILNVLREAFFSPEQIEVTDNQVAKNVFVKKGLEHFAETGVMINLPGQLLDPLSVDERIYILERMKKDVGTYYVMLDDKKLQVPDFIQIIHLNNQSCLISCLLEDKKFCCVISEKSVCLSLEDFIQDLYESGITEEDSVVIDVIDECINKLKMFGEEK